MWTVAGLNGEPFARLRPGSLTSEGVVVYPQMAQIMQMEERVIGGTSSTSPQ